MEAIAEQGSRLPDGGLCFLDESYVVSRKRG